MSLKESLIKLFIKNKTVKKLSGQIPENIKTVCFFSNTAIGDTLFSTPVWHALKLARPDIKIIAVLNPTNAKLFKSDPNIDELVLYNGRWSGFIKTVKTLAKMQIDTVFILHSNEPQATPLAVLSGAKYIIKLAKNSFNTWHSTHQPLKPISKKYVIYTKLAYLNFLGVYSDDIKMRLYLSQVDYQKASELLNKKPGQKLIGLQLGASTVSRQWFLSRWRELSILLLKHENVKIVLTGSPKERVLTNQLEKELQNSQISNIKDKVLNVAGELDIRAAAALIGSLDLFITPDTGPLHIAAALDTPTIGLFVAGVPEETNPILNPDLHPFIQKPKTCTPCIGKACKYAKCMLQISAQEVYEKAVKFI